MIDELDDFMQLATSNFCIKNVGEYISTKNFFQCLHFVIMRIVRFFIFMAIDDGNAILKFVLFNYQASRPRSIVEIILVSSYLDL